MIYDYCFEKRASGNWIDWMDTIDKQASAIAPAAKVKLCRVFLLCTS